MDNAADRKQIRSAEKSSKLRALQDREAVAAIMSTIPGRAWMWRKLEEAHIFTDPFTGDALREAYTKGERNFGQRLLSDIMAHCPDAYLQMTKEANNDRHDGNDRSPDLFDADTDPYASPERPSRPIANGEIIDRTPDQPKDPSLQPQKTADGTSSPTDKPVEKKADEPGKAPDTYAAFKAPENYTLDPKAVEAALPVFKELGLTQDQAQRLVDLQTAREIELAKAPTNAVETMRADWRAKVTADPELAKAVNGDKTGLDAVKLDIGRALTHLPPAEAAEFKQAMDLTGAGDHPAFVKAFWKLSQLITEGKHVNGAQPSPLGQKAPGASDRPSAAKSLFPSLPG